MSCNGDTANNVDNINSTEDDSTVYGGNGNQDINVMEGYVEDDLSDSSSSGPDIFDERSDDSLVKVNTSRKKFKLASHINQIQESPPIYFCTACKGHFSHKRTVRNHEYCVSGQKPYKCKLCDKRFLKKYDCDNHTRTHTGEKPFECSICQKSFTLKHKLNRHIRSHVVIEGEFKCELCQRSFSKPEALKKHEVTKHNGNNRIQCRNCRKNFNKIEERSKHRCIKKPRCKKLVCEMCGKTFSSKWNLIVHQKIHTSQRPFECEVCQKSFRLRQHRDRHATKHQPEADFECTLCKQTFGRKDNMIRHLKLNHPDRHLGIDIGEMVKTFSKKTTIVTSKQIVAETPDHQKPSIVVLEHLPNIRFAGKPKLVMDNSCEPVSEPKAPAVGVLDSSAQIEPIPVNPLVSKPSQNSEPFSTHSSVIKLTSSFQASESLRNEVIFPMAKSPVDTRIRSNPNSSDPNELLHSSGEIEMRTSMVEGCIVSDAIQGKSVIRALSDL